MLDVGGCFPGRRAVDGDCVFPDSNSSRGPRGAVANAALLTFANVYVSPITALQPSVPNFTGSDIIFCEL